MLPMSRGLLPNMISRVCTGLNYSRYIYLSWGCVGDLLVVHYGRVGMHIRWLDTKADIAFRINRIQAAMGIPKIEFHELDPRWVDEQLTEEEIQLRREDEEDDW